MDIYQRSYLTLSKLNSLLRLIKTSLMRLDVSNYLLMKKTFSSYLNLEKVKEVLAWMRESNMQIRLEQYPKMNMWTLLLKMR